MPQLSKLGLAQQGRFMSRKVQESLQEAVHSDNEVEAYHWMERAHLLCRQTRVWQSYAEKIHWDQVAMHICTHALMSEAALVTTAASLGIRVTDIGGQCGSTT